MTSPVINTIVETVIFVLLSIAKKEIMGKDRKSSTDKTKMATPNLSLKLYFLTTIPKLAILIVFNVNNPEQKKAGGNHH